MLTRRQALAVSSPSLALLLGSLAWAVWDRRGHLLDRTIRALTYRRD